VGVAGLLAIAVPLLLKPGTDAFNEQRNDIGDVHTWRAHTHHRTYT